MLFHTGALPNPGIVSYTRADARVELRLTKHVSASVVGQDLLDPHHLEYGGRSAIVTPTEIPRSALVQLHWHLSPNS